MPVTLMRFDISIICDSKFTDEECETAIDTIHDRMNHDSLRQIVRQIVDDSNVEIPIRVCVGDSSFPFTPDRS